MTWRYSSYTVTPMETRSDTKQHLTEPEARATIEAMNMDDAYKGTLLTQWLLGDRSATFVVFNAWRRQQVAS